MALNISLSRTPRLFLISMALLAMSMAVLMITPATTSQLLWVRWTAMMILAWWLPGALLAAHWRLPKQDLPTVGIFATGLGLVWMVALLLIAHGWAGPLTQWQLVAVYTAGAALLAVGLLWRRPLPLVHTDARTWIWVVGLLVLGGAMRLPGLAYHELHTDEVVLLIRAKDAINGQDDALAQHTKGPAEIAVETVVYRTLDTITEGTARMPFALISVFSIVAIALLGRSLYASSVGVWSGVLLAINGFVLGLSRIAQYQPAVILFSILATFAVWEFACTRRARWLALSVTLATWGVLFHYELALVLPSVGLAAWFGWRRSLQKRRVAVAFLSAAVAGGSVAGALYFRALLNPYFDVTQAYLDTRMGVVGQTFNLPFFIEISTFYNATWFVLGLILLAVAGLVIGWPRYPRQTTLLVLWFLPYLILYLFVVQFPGTHFYTIMPSWSLLAALTLAALTAAQPARPAARFIVWSGLTLWLALSTWYLYLVFFRQAPEYIVNYRAERSPLYWAPYGENVPEKPRFGLPIHEGWKTLGVLAEWHYLTGTYASNEYSRHLRWYLGGLERVPFAEQPDYIFVAEHLQEPDPAFDDAVLEGYQRVGEVQVRGEPRIAIWAREMLPGAYAIHHAEQFADVFTGLVAALEPWPAPSPLVSNVAFGEGLTLLSAGIDRTEAAQGEQLHVQITWKPDQPVAGEYKLFVHLADATGRPVAQWDGIPGLNTTSTSRWQPGVMFTDHVFLEIPADAQAGAYTVLAGLYDPVTGERMGNRAVSIATVVVR